MAVEIRLLGAARMSGWTAGEPPFDGLEAEARACLDACTPMDVPEGARLFSPGESVKGYVIVLSGRVGVHLVGPNGRDILLYKVAPGQACIQSTLGLFGGEDYTGEAISESACRLVLLPRAQFFTLLDRSKGFRKLVFEAFAARMQDMMQLVENVSFTRVETRLATLLVERADPGGRIEMTQADMAAAIGTAREVVSRRLERFARAGLITHGRGQVQIEDRAGLARLLAAVPV
jgi:CRP/FNR family transcriptional regulator